MERRHLTDEEIQLSAAGERALSAGMENHIAQCATCRAALDVYRAVLSGIAQQKAPSFEFDLTQAVLSSLSLRTGLMLNRLNYYLAALFTGGALAASYLLKSTLSSLFTSLSQVVVFGAVACCALVLFFQLKEVFIRYSLHSKSLDAALYN